MQRKTEEGSYQRAKASRTARTDRPSLSASSILDREPKPHGVFPTDIWRLILHLLSYAKLRHLTRLSKPLLSLIRSLLDPLDKRVPVDTYASQLRRVGAVRPMKEIPFRTSAPNWSVADFSFTSSGDFLFFLLSNESVSPVTSTPMKAQRRRASDFSLESEVTLLSTQFITGHRAQMAFAIDSHGMVFVCPALVSIVEVYSALICSPNHGLKELNPHKIFVNALGGEIPSAISVAKDDSLLVALPSSILALNCRDGSLLHKFAKPTAEPDVTRRCPFHCRALDRLVYFTDTRMVSWKYSTAKLETHSRWRYRLPDDGDAMGNYIIGQECGVLIIQQDGTAIRLSEFPLKAGDAADDDGDEDDDEDFDVYEPNEGSLVLLKVRNDGRIYVFRSRLSPTNGRMKNARITVYSPKDT